MVFDILLYWLQFPFKVSIEFLTTSQYTEGKTKGQFPWASEVSVNTKRDWYYGLWVVKSVKDEKTSIMISTI